MPHLPAEAVAASPPWHPQSSAWRQCLAGVQIVGERRKRCVHRHTAQRVLTQIADGVLASEEADKAMQRR